MGLDSHREIERKYLIRQPDAGRLKSQPGCVQWDIVQTYLMESEPGLTRRIRQVTTGGSVKYYKTVKRRLTALSCEEEEREISRSEYLCLLTEADPRRRPIEKTRYRIPHGGRVLEVDIYPFWSDRAILEIELERETDQPDIPACLSVIRDVSDDPAYKNSQLALRIPQEDI